jgi:hypothetical protein
VGAWYTIGLSLGVGLGLGVIFAGRLGASRVGLSIAAVAGAVAGVLVGVLVGDAAEAVAGGVGGELGVLSGAALVLGALRRGATRLGLAGLVGLAGVVVGLIALIPIAGYLEAVGLPFLAARMRQRQASRFAGLRTLAK